jgi:carbamoyltransferase
MTFLKKIWGKGYTQDETRQSLEKANISYTFVEDQEKIANLMMNDISSGKVITLHQGKFELGPRALGNRSILADPRRAEMKDIVNTKIKFREPFRPFAPVVLEEVAPEYYEGLEKQNVIPAVTH